MCRAPFPFMKDVLWSDRERVKNALLNPDVRPSWIRPTTGYDQYLFERFANRNPSPVILGLDLGCSRTSFSWFSWECEDPSERVIKLPKIRLEKYDIVPPSDSLKSLLESFTQIDAYALAANKFMSVSPQFIGRKKRLSGREVQDKADATDMLVCSAGLRPGEISTEERMARKKFGIASHHQSFYDIETRNRRLATAEAHLRRQLELKTFDFIVTCGAGSVAFGAALADRLSIDMMTVRKVGENTGAAATQVIGIADRMATMLKWIYVDDSIHSGDTIRHVLRLMNIHRPRWLMAGVYLHECENVDYMNSMTDFIYSDQLMCLPNYAHPCHNVSPSQ